MMFLIGFAITVAYSYSIAIVFGLQGMDFYWELDTLILIMLLGHWIEMRFVAGASKGTGITGSIIAIQCPHGNAGDGA